MIRLLTVAIVAGLICESCQQTTAAPSVKVKPRRWFPWFHHIFRRWRWTGWYSIDKPSGAGDYELLSTLRRYYWRQICARPAQMQVQTVSGRSVASTGDRIYRNHPHVGFICRNIDQCKKKCSDYRVRFKCRR